MTQARSKALAHDATVKSTHLADVKKLALLDEATVPQLEVIFSDGYAGVKGEFPLVISVL